MHARKLSRAVSRPLLVNAHAAFLPFLYRTNTICRGVVLHANTPDPTSPSGIEWEKEKQAIQQKWATGREKSRSIPRSRPSLSQQRSAAARRPRGKKRNDSIPFEGSTGSTNPDERFENTTLTPRELRIFEELFMKGVKSEPGESKAQFILRTQRAFPDLLKPLAEEAEVMRRQAMLNAGAETGAEAGQRSANKAKEFEIKDREAKRIQKLMDESKTDIELFRHLETEVFAGLRGLGEDRPIDSSKYVALPALLLHYVSLVQKHFPGSPLGLVLVPELKKLGPFAFTLGASTELYNQHMAMLWQKYNDVDGIVDILTEMDKEVYAFNDDTLELLVQMFEHAAAARRGRLGPGIRALWSTDRKERALDKLRTCYTTVSERSKAAALRKAQKQPVIDLQNETQKYSVLA